MTQSKSRQPVAPGSTGTYAVLPLRDIVVFPHMIVPLFVGREKSIRALEEVDEGATSTSCSRPRRTPTDDDPATDAIYKVGTLASVLQLLKLPDGTVKVLVEGASRAPGSTRYTRTDDYLRGRGRGARRTRSATRSRPRRWPARSCPSSRTT